MFGTGGGRWSARPAVDDEGRVTVPPSRPRCRCRWSTRPTPGAGFLATVGTTDPAELVAVLARGARRSRRGGAAAGAGPHRARRPGRRRSPTSTPPAAFADWRLDWYRGLAALAAERPADARAAFDAVYSELPGEPAAQLALAAARARRRPRAPRSTGTSGCGAPTADFVSAAFGLARMRLAARRPGRRVAVLDEVPDSSSHYVAAQVAAVRAQARRGAGPRAGGRPARRVGPAGAAAARRRAPRLARRRDAGDARWPGCAAGSRTGRRSRVLGHELTERSLRLGLEQAYRALAKLAPDPESRIGWSTAPTACVRGRGCDRPSCGGTVPPSDTPVRAGHHGRRDPSMILPVVSTSRSGDRRPRTANGAAATCGPAAATRTAGIVAGGRPPPGVLPCPAAARRRSPPTGTASGCGRARVAGTDRMELDRARRRRRHRPRAAARPQRGRARGRPLSTPARRTLAVVCDGVSTSPRRRRGRAGRGRRRDRGAARHARPRRPGGPTRHRGGHRRRRRRPWPPCPARAPPDVPPSCTYVSAVVAPGRGDRRLGRRQPGLLAGAYGVEARAADRRRLARRPARRRPGCRCPASTRTRSRCCAGSAPTPSTPGPHRVAATRPGRAGCCSAPTACPATPRIRPTLVTAATHRRPPVDAARALTRLALEGGGHDNITVAVLPFPPPAQEA